MVGRTLVVIALLVVAFGQARHAHTQDACSSPLPIIGDAGAGVTPREHGFYRIGYLGRFAETYSVSTSQAGGVFVVDVIHVATFSIYRPHLSVYGGSIAVYRGDGAYSVANGRGALSIMTQFAIFDVRVRLCSPATPTPPPTRTPSPTPGGGGGVGGGGGGGGVRLTPTQPAGGSGGGVGTPVPGWCGYTPSHPCFVVWATQQAQIELQTVVALQQSSLALQQTSVALAAVPTATPYAASAWQTAEAVAAQGPGAAVSYAPRGSATAEAYGYTFFVVERYSFGCPLQWAGWVTVCIDYEYVRDIQLFPNFYLPTWPFTAALVLIVLGFVIRR